MAKHKFASISLTVRHRAILSNFRPTGYLNHVLLAIFKKFSSPQKWRPFCIFEFLPKMAKHKFASISLTVRHRAISSKFSTHSVSEQCSLGKFENIFLSPKMVATLKFRIFAKNEKKHIFASISLTVRDRAISSEFSTHRVFHKCTLGNFQKKIPLPKNAGNFVFSNFYQKIAKHKFASISLTVRDRAISLKFSTHPRWVEPPAPSPYSHGPIDPPCTGAFWTGTPMKVRDSP